MKGKKGRIMERGKEELSIILRFSVLEIGLLSIKMGKVVGGVGRRG